MIKLPKEVSDQMKEHVLEMGYGWGILYRDDEVARNQKATDVVTNILTLFCNELVKNNGNDE